MSSATAERPSAVILAMTRKRVAHPTVGVIELDCQILTAENRTEKLVVFTVSAGTETPSAWRCCRLIGTETFTAPETVEADATG